ncbi:MAG: ribosome silencing factor [Clostridia bacterium]|jgi:ribosome-associated protein|nr:ribosome silencing factor [Clostridia bacterium]
MKNELLEKIINCLEDKKAIDIKTMEIKEDTTLADYFVVASGTSNTHIKALADNVEIELKQQDIYPNKIEGYNTATWILMDYGDIVVHIFTKQERENYNLEELWEKTKKNI